MKQDVKEKLKKDFKIDKETCETYEQFYETKIESALKLRFLSHLISTIEDMINDIFKEKYIMPPLKSNQYTMEQKRDFLRRNDRLYSIKLRPLKGLHNKGFTTHYNYGSIIVYNPDIMSDTDIRLLIAHEMGHIVNLYILHCEDTQNRANLFSYVAINGKDQFYKTKVKDFLYTSEFAIIDSIYKICPITKYKQVDH